MRLTEREHTMPNGEQNTPKLPYGVAPKTHSFLLAAIDYNSNVKNIFDNLDPTTLTLVLAYYFEEYSIRDLARKNIQDIRGLASKVYWELTSKSLTSANILWEVEKKQRLDKNTIKRRLVPGLNAIWQMLPSEIQEAHPKKGVIKIKEAPNSSPMVREKKSEATKALWKDGDYRKKTLQGMKTRGNNAEFTQKLKTTRNRNPRPQKTIEKIREGRQKVWNKKHNMPEKADLLTRRTELFGSWLEMTQLLGHSPSSPEVRALKRENKTPFSITMYMQEFGEGSFTIAKEKLERLTTLAVSSFEATKKLTEFLTDQSKELARNGIQEEEIQKYNVQMKERQSKILSATSKEEINQWVESLDLLLRRIKRKIFATTPFSFDDYLDGSNVDGSEEKIIFEARK